jgi:choline dehydrogenase-like flavoprotein
MKIIDINELQAGTTVTADICIVGSGAAGITVATELDGDWQTVCLIESGGFGPDEETQALYDVEIAGHPVREKFMSRARYFGGTCNLWAGRSMRLTPLDFSAREWIPDSGWPIPYEELEHYYPLASKILRLPSVDSIASMANVNRMNPVERGLFDHSDLQPTIAMWAKKPLRFGDVFRRQLRRSRNIAVYLNANVTDIRLNRAGDRVDECAAVALSGKKIHLKAKRFVLACGGLETARLLLASRSVQRHGVGNQFDVVGRYYMDHPRAVFGRVRLTSPQKLPLLLGTSLANGMAQFGIQFTEEVQRRERLLNNYLSLERHWSDQAARAYQSFVHSMKILLRKGYAGKRFRLRATDLAQVPELIYLFAPRELMPHFLYNTARRVKQWLSKGVTEMIVVNYCEQMPNPLSRVYLGQTRDRFDVPHLVLDWRIGQAETGSLMRLQALLDEYFRQHQLGWLDNMSGRFSDLLYTDASHHIGTARMSTDPHKGVVNEQCRVHGVDNLFVAGSAVFPTSGHANPTLTIVALAIRLAAHLKTATS